MNASWTIPPCIRPLDTGYFVLCEEAILRVSGEEYTIPAGFVFDGASVPPLIRLIVRLFISPAYTIKAALVHDYAYRQSCPWGLTRRDADELYGALLRHIKIELHRRWINAVVNAKIHWIGIPLHYAGVRIGGWASWKKRK